MSSFTKGAHQTKWIPVKNLSVVWAQSQRELNKKHAATIAANFDPDLFDDLVVTLPNGNGIYHVVDGQHRKVAVQDLYGEEEMVPCRVVDALDPARAAAIFDKINTSRRPPSALEKFNVRVVAGYETEVAIHKLVTGLGYKITGGSNPGSMRAVGSLIKVTNNYGLEVLKESLMTIKGTWGDEDASAVDGPIIEGFAALIAEHRGHLDWKHLREKVARSYTPGRLLGQAKADREIQGGNTADGVRRMLLKSYNHGIRNKLS